MNYDPPGWDKEATRPLMQAQGGESVSQSSLKDKAFSASRNQNPPFALRPKE